DDGARLAPARPADEHRHAEAAFPRRSLLAVERRHAAVGPGYQLRAVVGAVDDDRVVGDPEIVELLEHPADHVVVLDQAVGIEADAGTALRGWLEMRPHVHARGVEPHEEGLAALDRAAHELLLCVVDLQVDRGHPRPGERAGILDLLSALAVGPGVQHAAWTERLPELGSFG